MIIRIFEIVFPLFAVVSAGFIYGYFHKSDMDVANRINIDVFVPALIFSALSDQTFDFPTYGKLALGGLVVVLGSGLIAWPLARLARAQTNTFVPPIMFCNSGNMGLPLQVLAFGELALPAALVLFLMENALHFTLGIHMLDRRARWWIVFRQPMILAATAALIVSFTGTQVPQSIALPVEMLGEIAVPLMLFSLGVRLAGADFSEWRIGLLGAVLSPLLGITLAMMLLPLLDLTSMQAGMLLMFGVLPPAVLNFMIAERYNQEPGKVASIVMLGNLSALAFVPLALAYVLPRYG